ncbi:MAG TPA: FGGY family carbohydrate kinase [Polyangiaceae bacterium]|nr:FGGY family carbohydrate kinase [Polyangiaceae bacterium]
MTRETASDLVLAIDASTTACKALAFDAKGAVHAEGRSAIALGNPEPDAYEQDAEEWWIATFSAMREAVLKLGARAKCVRAVGLTHQRETFVLSDAACRPLHPALVWMDARCREEVREAIGQLGEHELHRITGKPASTTPSFYKLAYVLKRKPELIAPDLRVLDVGAFLGWRLTGRCATSLASADPLGLVDMQRNDWAETLLGYLGLTRVNVPELVAPGSVLGLLKPDVARDLGLDGPLPLVAGAGDGQAAGLGAGIIAPGRAYLNLGTAIVSGVLAHEYRTDVAFRTLYGAAPGTFFLETDLKGGTFTLNWLAEKWLRASGETRPLDELLQATEKQAAVLPPGADGLVLVPYWNGVMNPYWDDDATGITLGWHGAHGPAHLYRAFLEGIAFEQRLHSRGVELATAPIAEFVVMGGGAKSDLWCQILADVLERRVVRSATHEASALGAAMLASVAAGLFPSLDAAASGMARTSDAFTSGAARAFYSSFYDEAYVKLYPALRESLRALAQLRTQSRTIS